MGRELRAEARISVSRKGALSFGDTWFPCMIVDASESGFAMVCTRPLVREQILDFRCQLDTETVFECKVEIRYLNDDGAGVMITDIEPEALMVWKLYLRRQSILALLKK